MPQFPYSRTNPALVRKDPLGASHVNQLHENIEALDAVTRIEHRADGTHNAIEIPWVLGRIVPAGAFAAALTGYMFDLTYGGTTLVHEAEGQFSILVESGVITTSTEPSAPADGFGGKLWATMCNVSDADIANKPYFPSVTPSITEDKFLVTMHHPLSLATDTVDESSVEVDIAIFAASLNQDASTLTARLPKKRGDYLTEASTDWNALVQNQGSLRKSLMLEHNTTGTHNVARIAKAALWCSWNGATQDIDLEDGIASISRISQGVVEVTMDSTFTATTEMACFAKANGGIANEMTYVINGRAISTTKFRFYSYEHDFTSGSAWARVDVDFFAVFFGTVA